MPKPFVDGSMRSVPSLLSDGDLDASAGTILEGSLHLLGRERRS